MRCCIQTNMLYRLGCEITLTSLSKLLQPLCSGRRNRGSARAMPFTLEFLEMACPIRVSQPC